jgi:hypothetical protein
MFSRTRPGRGVRSYHPWSNRGGLVVQTSMCVEAHLSRRLVCQVLRAVESPLRGYKDI